jgi:hypothetical protein
MQIYYHDNLQILKDNYKYKFYYNGANPIVKYEILSACREFLKYKKRGVIPYVLLADLVDARFKMVIIAIVIFISIIKITVIYPSAFTIITSIIFVCGIYYFDEYMQTIINKLKE